jgi:hypothetical protein
MMTAKELASVYDTIMSIRCTEETFNFSDKYWATLLFCASFRFYFEV